MPETVSIKEEVNFADVADQIVFKLDKKYQPRYEDNSLWVKYSDLLAAVVSKGRNADDLVQSFRNIGDEDVCEMIENLSTISINEGRINLLDNLIWRIDYMISTDAYGRSKYLDVIRKRVQEID